MPRIGYVERANRFDADLAAAHGDGQLIALLARPGLDEIERAKVVAELGASGTGPEGSAAVRAQFSDVMERLGVASKSAKARWRDLACAAVFALARREGSAGTDVYLAAALSASQAVRDYGLAALCDEGDDRGWDRVLARVEEIVSRRPVSYGRWYELLQLVSYLARHAARGSARAEQLIAVLRANWGALDRPPQRKVWRGPCQEPEAETAPRLEEMLPGLEPDGPPAAALDLPRLARREAARSRWRP